MTKPKIYTTYELIKKAYPCEQSFKSGVKKFGGVKKHGKTTKTHLSRVLTKIGLDDTLWIIDNAITGADAHRIKHQFRADCAIRVLKHFERKRPNDNRPRKAIISSRRYAVGKESAAAWVAAKTAAGDAARAAAWDAAWDAAGDAARAAAWDAARDAAGDAARAAAGDAAGDAEYAWQEKTLKEYLSGSERSLRMPKRIKK